jgi:hypothetical protein
MKTGLILLGILGLMLIGCAIHSYLPFYGTPDWNTFYTGGDGSTTQKAIVINSTDDKKTTDAENHYLANTLTLQGTNYQVTGRDTYNTNGRIYDRIDVVINQSTQREYHFDVTIPRGQSLQP